MSHFQKNSYLCITNKSLLFRDAYKIDLRMRMKIAKSRIDIVLSQQRELMLDKYPNLLNRDTQSITKVTKTIET